MSSYNILLRKYNILFIFFLIISNSTSYKANAFDRGMKMIKEAYWSIQLENDFSPVLPLIWQK